MTKTLLASSFALVLLNCAGNGTSPPSTTATAASTEADPCMMMGHCPRDPKEAVLVSPKCREEVADAKCGSKTKAYYACRAAKEVCAPEGTVDSVETMKACKAEMDAMTTCTTGIAQNSALPTK